MKKLMFALLVALGFAGMNVTNATVSTSAFKGTLQDTTVKKDTTKTPTDTLKTKKPKQ